VRRLVDVVAQRVAVGRHAQLDEFLARVVEVVRADEGRLVLKGHLGRVAVHLGELGRELAPNVGVRRLVGLLVVVVLAREGHGEVERAPRLRRVRRPPEDERRDRARRRVAVGRLECAQHRERKRKEERGRLVEKGADSSREWLG